MRQVTGDVRQPVEAGLWAVLDLLPFAVILIGAEGRVQGMNIRGQALLREADAMRFDGASVHATDAARDARLQAALAAGKSSVLLVNRLSGGPPLEVAVTALPGDLCALIVGDPGRTCSAKVDRIRALYRLTPAESRVLGAVVEGEGSDAAAQRLGMSVHTLRRHLKSIFAKMNVDRQSQLVKVVLLGVALLGE
jgi:DNA-binding CsgD family transcriptional regulator